MQRDLTSLKDQMHPFALLGSWVQHAHGADNTGTAGNIMSRRIVMSVRKKGPGPFILPATLDVMVSK
jgi:hypothetical protein